MDLVSRRSLLICGAAAASGFAPRSGLAESAGQGLLARLQASKTVRVGIANQPPFSSLNPDGTMTGVAPTISKAVMSRLGITKIEGFIGTYGELIPGMLAGRWDYVSASLTITKPRCEQVLFSDPIVLDGPAIIKLKSTPGPTPKSLAELKSAGALVGSEAGGADFRKLVTAGVPLSQIRQFPNDPAMMDGMLAKRVRYAVIARSALRAVLAQRKIDLDVVFPIPDDPVHGSGCAFRKQDVDLHAAFQKELRAMKASGEFFKIVAEFGFETSPELLHATDKKMCA